MGVAGAALSTLLSRIVSAAILLIRIQIPSEILNLNGITKYKPNTKMIQRILRVGIPTGFENGCLKSEN